MQTTAVRTPVHIRWHIRRDMPQTLAIERASFALPWSEEDFLNVFRQRNCIGMVAERVPAANRTHFDDSLPAADDQDSDTLGYIIYELQKGKFELLNLAVHPDHRRAGIGVQLIDKLKGKLSLNRRDRLTVCVRESNLAAQLFFRAQDFRAVRVLRGHYDDNGESAYLMECKVREPAAPF